MAKLSVKKKTILICDDGVIVKCCGLDTAHPSGFFQFAAVAANSLA